MLLLSVEEVSNVTSKLSSRHLSGAVDGGSCSRSTELDITSHSFKAKEVTEFGFQKVM